MRITIAILGLASTTLWGCSDNVSGEDLKKEAADIRKKYDGRLHELELEFVDPFVDFTRFDSSTRRFAKKLLKSAYKDAKDPITEQEIRDALADLRQLGVYEGNMRLGIQMLHQFKQIDADQNKRLGAAFRQKYQREKKIAVDRKGVLDKIQAIETKYRGQLDGIEYEELDLIKFHSFLGEKAQSYNELLDSIYCDNPKYSPVTKSDIEAMIKRSSEWNARSLQDLLRDYDTIPDSTKKRIKGWFGYIDRRLDEIEMRNAGADY
jgi:hypothetical protein